MKLRLPGPAWYRWKAAGAGTGVILGEMIRAAGNPGHDRHSPLSLPLSNVGGWKRLIPHDM